MYFIYYSGSGSKNIDFFIHSILKRLFGVYTLALAAISRIIEQYGYFNGSTIINPLGLFPHDFVSLSAIVHHELFSHSGEAPPPALGFAFVDFGWLGVVLLIVIINFIILMIQFLISNIKNKALSIALTVILIIKIMYLSMTSIFTTLLNPKEILVISILLLIYALSRVKILK